MVEVAVRRSIDETLRLALDVCLGVGAFWVRVTGGVSTVVSDAMPPEDGERRIAHLARNCLVHPAAGGRETFWNAEVSTEADSADRSLACVVVPSWRGGARAGLLGVVDTWLPEPDGAQRAALISMAAELAVGTPPDGGDGPGDGDGPDGGDVPDALDGAAGGDGDSPWGSDRARLGLFAPAPPATPPGAGSEVDGCVLGAAPPGDSLALAVLCRLPDAVVVTRRDGAIVFANDRFSELVGRGTEQLGGCNVRTFLTSDAGRPFGSDDASGGDGRYRPGRRLLVASSSGERLPVTATDVRIGGGSGAADTGSDRFVTVLRPAPWAEGCSAAARIDCVDLVGNLDDGVLCLDSTGTVALSNRAADRYHGLASGQTLVGSFLPDTSGLCTEEGQPLTADAHPGILALRHGAACAAHLVIGGEGDRQQHVTVTARPFPVDGGPGALVVLHDSTSEWHEQKRLTQYALYDPLTGLANRYLLLEELRRMLLLLGRQGGAVALVYLDLDGFKSINDDHGHDVGDEVLAAVARRLRGAVRSDDVVARLGGDEFVIAHASTERLPDGDLVVSRLRKVLSAPFRVRSQAFDVGASIGWVSTDRGEEGPDALLAKADRAMYLQKRNRAAARRGSA